MKRTIEINQLIVVYFYGEIDILKKTIKMPCDNVGIQLKDHKYKLNVNE